MLLATHAIACVNVCLAAIDIKFLLFDWCMLEQVMFTCGKYNLVHDFFMKVQKSSIPNALTYRGTVMYFSCEYGIM